MAVIPSDADSFRPLQSGRRVAFDGGINVVLYQHTVADGSSKRSPERQPLVLHCGGSRRSDRRAKQPLLQVRNEGMAAGVIDRLWSMGDLFDAVTEHSAQVKAKAARDRRIQRLIDRLKRGE
jgi:hypothetical protein